jgi:hypothetical protein
LNRREFTVEAALALLGGAIITIGGCDNGTEPSPVIADIPGEVGTNHGHFVTLTAAGLRAGGALDIDIRGSSGHGHMVSLSTVDLAILRNGGVVQKESTGTRHTHLVTFRG